MNLSYSAEKKPLRVERWENDDVSGVPKWSSIWVTWTHPDTGTRASVWIKPDEVPWLVAALQASVQEDVDEMEGNS